MNAAEIQPGRTDRAERPERPLADHRRAIVALARVEARRLLRHPLTLAAIALAAVLLWMTGKGSEPMLHLADIDTQWPLFVLAAATMITANLAVLRPHRHATGELYGTVRLGPAGRTAAHLLSLLPVALAGAVLACGYLGWQAAGRYAVGRPDPAELATGPMLILVLGAIGVLLGRLVRSVLVGPLSLVGLFAVLSVLGVGVLNGGRVWLAVLPVTVHSDPPPELLDRPAGWHLAYAGAVAAALAAAALWHAGAIRTGVAGLAAGLAVAVLAGSLQVAAAPQSERGRQRLAEATAGLRADCRQEQAVSYCAYPGFESRIVLWRPVVQAVRAQLPAAAVNRPLRVRQQLPAEEVVSQGLFGATVVSGQASTWSAGVATVDLGWPRGDAARWARLRLAVRTAVALVGLPQAGHEDTGQRVMVNGQPSLCRSTGSGGVALWLAGQVSPDLAAGIRSEYSSLRDTGPDSLRRYDHEPVLGSGEWSPAELDQALRLLDRPRDEVRALVHRNWALLTAPDTTLAQVAAAFGLPAPVEHGAGITAFC